MLGQMCPAYRSVGHPRLLKLGADGTESNLRPEPYKGTALPLSYASKMLSEWLSFEQSRGPLAIRFAQLALHSPCTTSCPSGQDPYRVYVSRYRESVDIAKP